MCSGWNKVTTGITPQIPTSLTRELQRIQNRQGLSSWDKHRPHGPSPSCGSARPDDDDALQASLTFTRQVYPGRRTSTSSGWGPSIFRNRDDQQTFLGSPSQHRRLMRRGEALAPVASIPAQRQYHTVPTTRTLRLSVPTWDIGQQFRFHPSSL